MSDCEGLLEELRMNSALSDRLPRLARSHVLIEKAKAFLHRRFGENLSADTILSAAHWLYCDRLNTEIASAEKAQQAMYDIARTSISEAAGEEALLAASKCGVVIADRKSALKALDPRAQ